MSDPWRWASFEDKPQRSTDDLILWDAKKLSYREVANTYQNNATGYMAPCLQSSFRVLGPFFLPISATGSSGSPLGQEVLHEADQQRADLVGDQLVAHGVRVHAVAQHLGGVAVVLGAVGDDDGGLGRVVALDPAGDLGVEGDDWRGGEGEGDELVDLGSS